MRQVFFAQSSRFGQAQCRSLKNAVGRLQIRLLGHIGNAQIGLQLQLPIVCVGQAAKNFQQGRLARPIAPNQAYALSTLKRKIRVI